MNYDIYLVGVGGQGILTVGEILAEAAMQRGIPVNFYPSKGMAQRGGFVKAQLRLGREHVGPNLPERSADLAIAMEQSEALKAIRYVKPGGDFVLFADVWAPTAVMLGKAGYPSREQVSEQIRAAGARLTCFDPSAVPAYQGVPVQANVFLLGVALRQTGLGRVFEAAEVDRVIQARWKKAAEVNRFAFQAGYEAPIAAEEPVK